MKVCVFKTAKQRTTYLQGLGHVEGTPAGELKVGNTLVWNNGATSTVLEILKETPKTITILEGYGTEGQTYERKLLKTRIVARPAVELPSEETESNPVVDGVPGVARTSQTDDIPFPGTNTQDEQVDGVVVITEGPDVDAVTELFDGNAKEIENAAFIDAIAKRLSEEGDDPEAAFEREAAAFILNANKVEDGPIEEPALYPGYYPNQVTFDRVRNLYPGFEVVGIEKAFIPGDGWRKPADLIGENALEYWEPYELVQYLKDKFAAVSFALIIEDQNGRRKNPDYKYKELTVGLEVGDLVLYTEERSGRQQEGRVSSLQVNEGRAKVWVRYTTGSTGALTPLSELSKL